ncbi:Inosine-5'-monophosphate dehydrogenase [Acorus gramineus]|uniref:Inosine-5'-monophosphate dehydrogenase n=1 Tax=Acorus gramineus TaxID=55184 RepID=A0AAV9B8Z8_ACOGR|nr:Inosine-5'-monophosphate dehydrogenase [Acorus gramineus]
MTMSLTTSPSSTSPPSPPPTSLGLLLHHDQMVVVIIDRSSGGGRAMRGVVEWTSPKPAIDDGFSADRLFNQGFSYTYDDVIFLPPLHRLPHRQRI